MEGFLLLVENNYAYRQNEFRRKVPSPVFLFLAKELPSRNRDFRSSTADLDHPIFHQYFDITYPPAIARERKQNPYYRGETIFVFKNNLVGYTLALFAFDDGDKFVPLRKPYQVYALWPEGYRLIINAYLYGLAH